MYSNQNSGNACIFSITSDYKKDASESSNCIRNIFGYLINMLSLVLFLIRLLAVLNLPTTAGVVYYVKPTEPCAHNSSCPSNETCHTMDHYASNSSYYFSPDLINVTLYFMCGVHNCTQHMDISDLERFIMIGTLGRNHVTIYMPIPIQVPNDPQNSGNRTYRFANVSILRIENVTLFFISLNFIGKQNCQF